MAESGVKAIAFDVDGTLVHENFWGVLNRAGGLSEEDDIRLMEHYAEGKITYRQWMDSLSEVFRKSGFKRADIERILDTYRFAPGVRETVNALRAFPMALISSNIDTYVEDVARELGIPHAYGYVRMEYNGEQFERLGFLTERSELEAKVDALGDFAAKAGIAVTDIAFVGDSRNDLDAFTATGRGILIGEGNEELRQAAWRRVATLPEILQMF